MHKFDDPRALMAGTQEKDEPQKPVEKSGPSDILRALIPGQLGRRLVGSATSKIEAAAGKGKPK